MIQVYVTYKSGLSELIEVPITRPFQDLRNYFAGAESVEILSVVY